MIRRLTAVGTILMLSALPAVAQSLSTQKPCEPWPKCILEPPPQLDPGKPRDPSTIGIRQMRIPDKVGIRSESSE